MRIFIAAFAVAFCLAMPAARAVSDADYAQGWKQALAWLAPQQADDGSFGQKDAVKTGATALILEAWAAAPASVREANADFADRMRAAADWLASHQDTDGAIAVSPENRNYSTSLAVRALAGYDRERYAPVIAKAVAYLSGLQANAERRYDKTKHTTFGGFGYGSSLRPDLSNTFFALGALHAAGVPAADPVWADALVFIRRCQNSSEVNDQPYAGEDGGAMYLPGDKLAGTDAGADGKEHPRSMGSMTAAMLAAYLWCGQKPDSKEVDLSSKWLRKNFSVTENPGHLQEGQMALYYYYRALAVALAASGQADFGGHDWRGELAAQLLAAQRPDGTWANGVARFGENDPLLCTGYALCALALCK